MENSLIEEFVQRDKTKCNLQPIVFFLLFLGIFIYINKTV